MANERRKPGRPFLPAEERRIRVSFRCSPDILKAFRDAARRHGERGTLTEVCERALKRYARRNRK